MGTDFPPAVINIILVIVGLSLGSFATALAHRVPEKKAIGGTTRSACPNCNHTLGAIDLIPVVSWVMTAGKCRYCAKEISLSYPLTELGVLMACLIVYWVKGATPDTFFIIAAVPFLAALLVVDLKHMILPNVLLIIVGVIGFARLMYHAVIMKDAPDFAQIADFLSSVVVFAAMSWVLGFIMEKLLKSPALGMGDVKFFAVAGIWLGLLKLNWFCGISGFLGVVFAGIFRNYGAKRGRPGVFPFGPALIGALFLLLLTDGSLFG